MVNLNSVIQNLPPQFEFTTISVVNSRIKINSPYYTQHLSKIIDMFLHVIVPTQTLNTGIFKIIRY